MSFLRALSSMRSETKRSMVDLGVVTKIDDKAIVENLVTKSTNTLQSQMFKAVESKFEDTLQTKSSSSRNGLISSMSNVVKQALSEMFQSGRVPTESNTEIRSLVRRKSVTYTIVKSLLYSTRFVVPIVETSKKMVDRAVDKYSLQDMEWAWTAVANDKLSIELYLSRSLKLSKILSDPHSHEELRRSCPPRQSSFHHIPRDNSVSKRYHSVSDSGSNKNSERCSNCSHHSIDTRCDRSPLSSNQYLTVF